MIIMEINENIRKYVEKLFIESEIALHENNHKKALDNLLEIYSYNLISYDILKYLVQIYLTFDNYSYALKYVNILIEKYKKLKDYEIKYLILSKLNDYGDILSFLDELCELETNEDYILNLKNVVKIKLESIVINQNINENLLELKNNYLSKLTDYCNLINVLPKEILSDPKKEFRYFCYYHTDLIRKLKLPDIKINQNNEAVLIEFRILHNLEFVIRNTIHKLGNDWSYTIICGNLNYDYLFNLCNSISNNIKIIKLNYNNISMTDYNQILSSKDFWNLFHGDKILIHQEDTCIFKNNINDFMEWDYIGAPFRKSDNTNSYHVGNGGFSLRSKSVMLKVIENINIVDTKLNQYYDFPPEDLYFTNNMIDLNIGKLADYDTALNFSTEYVVNINAFGSHAFFLHNPEWKTVMYLKLLNNIN
jgi:hypothetical protein